MSTSQTLGTEWATLTSAPRTSLFPSMNVAYCEGVMVLLVAFQHADTSDSATMIGVAVVAGSAVLTAPIRLVRFAW